MTEENGTPEKKTRNTQCEVRTFASDGEAIGTYSCDSLKAARSLLDNDGVQGNTYEIVKIIEKGALVQSTVRKPRTQE